MTVTFFKKQFIIFLIILFTFANNISCASILSTSNNTIAISNITSTAIQSTINGDDFTEALKHQAINTVVMAGANYTANQIGQQYHTNNLNFGIDGTTGTVINKLTQLTLHAGLGALTNTITGNDAMSGAISGVVGEMVTGWIFDSLNEKYANENGIIDKDRFESNRSTVFESGGLASAVSSLFIGKAKGLDISNIRNNIYASYRVGKNAGENNRTYYAPGTAIGGRAENDHEKDLKTANKFKEAFKDDGEAKVVKWDGENRVKDRKNGAQWIEEDLKNNPLKEGEQLNLVGFSHGGNVVKETTNLDLGYKVDNIVFLATPHINIHTLNYDIMSKNGKIYNFYGTNDYVQGSIAMFGTNFTLKFDYPYIYIPKILLNIMEIQLKLLIIQM